MNEELQVSEVMNREALEEQIQRRVNQRGDYQPYITISRDPGSGGRPIAELVAKKLKFKLYDKELVYKVSEKIRKPFRLLRKVDEKERSGMMDLVQNILNPDYVSDETYFRTLTQVVLEIAKKGSCVIVGRGSNFIAPKSQGLQVQITAPYRLRVAHAIEYEKIDYSKARDVIRHVSEQRERFIKQYFGKDVHAARYYDVTINTTYFTLEQAADMVIQAYRAKFPETLVNFASTTKQLF